jgi:hypothetical protein
MDFWTIRTRKLERSREVSKKADTTILRENRGIKQNTDTYSQAPMVKEKVTKGTVAMVLTNSC